jgi:hypothetical protein
MLVNAARSEQQHPFALVAELTELLKSSSPTTRQRAARCAIPLVELEFANGDWWHISRYHPTQPIRTSPWRGSFPRPSAIRLARQTLLLAWNSLRRDRLTAQTAQILFGMTAQVSEIIVNLELDDIDRIAQTRFRHVHPRWDDRPGVWRRLLIAAQTGDQDLLGLFNLHCLQLLTSELQRGVATNRPAKQWSEPGDEGPS